MIDWSRIRLVAVDNHYVQGIAKNARFFRAEYDRVPFCYLLMSSYRPIRWAWGDYTPDKPFTERGWFYGGQSENTEQAALVAVKEITYKHYACPVCYSSIGLCDSCEESAIDEMVLEYLKLSREKPL